MGIELKGSGYTNMDDISEREQAMRRSQEH